MRTLLPVAFAALIALAAPAHAIEWGIGGPSILKKDRLYEKAFAVMKDRGLKTYRVNVNLTPDQPDAADEFRQMLTSAQHYGIELKPVLFVAFQWQDKADLDPSTIDGDKLYQDAYDRTLAFVSQFREVRDWEMGNEINLKSRLDNGGDDLSHRAGWRESGFDTPRMRLWARVLRGHSDAIAKVNANTGSHLRRVLNTTGLQFAFLDYMADQGVAYDVVSYHYYERIGIDMQRFPSHGLGTIDLFEQLARFKKPIIINETNCSEIYNDRYENVEGGTLNDECIRSFYNILRALSKQTVANIEGVQVHTFVDIPGLKPPSETRFGMMYDLDHPKLAMAILASFAGGHVSADERDRMTALGLSEPAAAN